MKILSIRNEARLSERRVSIDFVFPNQQRESENDSVMNTNDEIFDRDNGNKRM